MYRNSEGYADPTAGQAIGNVMKEYRIERKRVWRRQHGEDKEGIHMTAKEYLGQAYHIDQRIDSKIMQTESLHALATKATATLNDAPVSNTKNTHSMVAKGPNAVAHFSSSKASFFTSAEKELANTLVATDYKDPPLVNGKGYIVRRLTPKECARLQGFPDGWCSGLGTEEPSDEEIRFFTDVFEEYRKATAPDKKPKTEKQILKWLKDPHSDSAEYKMWGNGVALP